MEKQCENCGEVFPCNPEGVKKSVSADFRVGGCNDCWCHQFELGEAHLTRIEQQFQDCLCPQCLTALAMKGLNG